MSENKLPNLIDRHVGRRLRWRRREMKLSQERLGDMLGLTFQQVQKYERGVNRISAGRLFELAGVLEVPIAYFFDGADDFAALAERAEALHEAPPAGMDVLEMLDTESIELLMAFHRIPDAKLRRSLVATVTSAAAAFAQGEDEDA